ncbi:unnamed protein product, partial [Allacma fusca]
MFTFGPEWDPYIRKSVLWSKYTWSLPVDWNTAKNCPEVSTDPIRLVVCKASVICSAAYDLLSLYSAFRLCQSSQWERSSISYRLFVGTLVFENAFFLLFYPQCFILVEDVVRHCKQYNCFYKTIA